MYTSECFITTTENPEHKVNIRKWNGITGSWDYANAQFKSGVKVRLDPKSSEQISPGPFLIDGGIKVANFYDVVGVGHDGGLIGGYVAEEVLKPIECEKKLINQTDETKIPEYSDPSTNGNGNGNGNGGGGGGLALVGLLGITLLALDNK